MDHDIIEREAPPSFEIRGARMGDGAALDKLLTRSYAALLRPDYDPALLQDILPFIGRSNPRLLQCESYYVAEDTQGDLLAAGGWSWIGPQGGVGPVDMAHVRHVACHQDHARKGIAGRLMRHAIETARHAGARVLNCQSTLTAAPFYEALGFARVAEIEIFLCPGLSFPAVHMRAQL